MIRAETIFITAYVLASLWINLYPLPQMFYKLLLVDTYINAKKWFVIL